MAGCSKAGGLLPWASERLADNILSLWVGRRSGSVYIFQKNLLKSHKGVR